MIIIALVILGVVLPLQLNRMALEHQELPVPSVQRPHISAYRDYAEQLLSSKRFVLYLIYGLGGTLITTTALTTAILAHIKGSIILATFLAAFFFIANALLDGRRFSRLCRLAGLGCAVFAVLGALRG